MKVGANLKENIESRDNCYCVIRAKGVIEVLKMIKSEKSIGLDGIPLRSENLTVLKSQLEVHGRSENLFDN